MHELSIAQAVVAQATALMEEQGGQYVQRVALSIGVLSGVEKHALEQVFPIACEGTPVQGASLAIEMVEATVFCNDCDAEVTVALPFMVCANCHGRNVEIKAGHEMIIRQLEMGFGEAQNV